MTHDITHELVHEPLNRADPAPDWGDYIPFDGAPLPPEPDPAAAPTALELEAAAAFDCVLTETGDVFAADAALVAVLRRNGKAEAVLDACNADLISIEQTATQMKALARDTALPVEPSKKHGIMWKR
jgi:hypothetical protein